MVHASVQTYNNTLIFGQREIKLSPHEGHSQNIFAVDIDEFEEELLDSWTNKALSIEDNPLLTDKENVQLKQLLLEQKDCFALDLLDLKPPIDIQKHQIHTITNVPIQLYSYRKSYSDREILNEQIQQILEAKIIRHSSSPWSFPVVLVGKIDKSKRLCVNYNKLNDIIITDPFPIPLIGDILDRLGSSFWFTDLE